ncbi:MAG: DUF1569 domain-containing protein [Casimicrobium sp.]
MKRRTLVSVSGILVASAAGGWFVLPSGAQPLTVASASDALSKFKGARIKPVGGWTPAQVFEHLAQSIEYSMTGFPESKSALFQSTAGAAAFAVFKAKGAMKHGLTEVIPGAPTLATNGDQDAALDRLLKSLSTFDAFNGALKPHFAYGDLDKQSYAAAHAMHVFNHLTEFSA